MACFKAPLLLLNSFTAFPNTLVRSNPFYNNLKKALAEDKWLLDSKPQWYKKELRSFSFIAKYLV